MPATAYAVVALFAVVSLAAGALAAWVVGPRRWWAAVLPAAAAFAALYLIGHRFVISIGPEVPYFGFRIALPFEVGAALATAFAAAALQVGVVRLLQAQERGAGRDGLA